MNIFYLDYLEMAKDKKITLKRNLDDWHDVGNGIVRNNEGLEGQISRIIVDPLYDTSNENDIYDYRRDTKSPLVKAYGSMLVEKKKETDKTKKVEKDPNVYMDAVV